MGIVIAQLYMGGTCGYCDSPVLHGGTCGYCDSPVIYGGNMWVL